MYEIKGEFIEGLKYLIETRKTIIQYCQVILNNPNKNQDIEVENLVSMILTDYTNKYPNQSEEDLLKSSLKVLINKQLKNSKLANKIREGKGNPPPSFMQ